ncbi:MAG TPA: hypothetical protein PKN80_07460, partial [bacterium]|nr:hypothetical protein [bacterium]
MAKETKVGALVRVWSAAAERQRLENLALARRLIRRSIGHQVLVDYRPGHVWYNYAEYPAEPLSIPDEADERKFARYRELGIEVFKIHEEWNDAFEVYGADKFSPNNRRAFRTLIDRVHAHGMKFLPYISTGYYDKRSRRFRSRWANYLNGKIKSLTGGYYDLAECSPRSPEWRAFLLGAVERLMAEYPLDGLYNDVGYNSLAMYDPPDPQLGQVNAFEESPQRDGAFEDLTQELYTIVKRHRGIYATHFGRYYRSYNNYFTPDPWPPRFQCYDYTFAGEAVGSLDALLRKVRRQPPFVLYIPDWRYIEKQQPGLDSRAVYAISIPYLQFPVLYDGRPITGKKYWGRKLKYAPVATGELPWPDQIAGYYAQAVEAIGTDV